MAKLGIKFPGSELDGREIPLNPGGELRIGRIAGNDLVLLDKMVSRTHAVIAGGPQGYVLTDLGSSVGTFINGTKVSLPVVLAEGDEIKIGEAVLCVRLEVSVPIPPKAVEVVAVADFAVPEVMYSDEIMLLKRRIHEQVLTKLNLRDIASKQLEDHDLLAKLELALDGVLKDVRHEIPVGVAPELLRSDLLDELVAFGPITPMIRDASVTEIMVNSASRIFVERKGLLVETRARFFDDRHLMTIIRRIVEPLGRHVDESSPKVDGRLPDGSRVNAVIPPLALDGPSMTIRKFPEKKLTTDDLIAYGSMTAPMAEFLHEAVRARQNILVSGGTGSGKTTLLNILSQFIPSTERLVTIEDSAELKLTHRNLVRLEARPANIEGRGKIGKNKKS